MAIILDLGRRANGTGPILGNEDRGANSPDEPGIEAPLAHAWKVVPARTNVNHAAGRRVILSLAFALILTRNVPLSDFEMAQACLWRGSVSPVGLFSRQEDRAMYAKGALLVVVVLAVGACTRGARDVDYPPSRGISDDVDAAHQTSPLITQGQRQRNEPYDAFPWRLDERHQSTP